MTQGGVFIAHLTDLHLPIPSQPSLHELIGKRGLGYFSWVRERRFRHRIDALERIVRDCGQAAPDFVAISGDLVNISTPEEFSAAFQWLEGKFHPSGMSLCPGNHDAFVSVPWNRGLGLYSRFMAGDRNSDGSVRPPSGPEDFPFVRRVGRIGLVFANSAPPTLPGLATGRLGAGQIEKISQTLKNLGEAGLCRILVLHHPITEGAVPGRKALADRKALRAALNQAGVELVLHGHTHFPLWDEVETKDGVRPVIGGGSASHSSGKGRYRPARYNLYEIGGDAAAGWRIDAEVRELDPETGDVKTAERRRLLTPAP